MYLLIWSQLSEIERCKEYALQISLRKAFKAKRTEYKASGQEMYSVFLKRSPEATVPDTESEGEMQVRELGKGI